MSPFKDLQNKNIQQNRSQINRHLFYTDKFIQFQVVYPYMFVANQWDRDIYTAKERQVQGYRKGAVYRI